jgi:hypothetical protein
MHLKSLEIVGRLRGTAHAARNIPPTVMSSPNYGAADAV